VLFHPFLFLKKLHHQSILVCLCGARERGNLQSQYNRQLLTSTLAFLPGQKTSEVSSVEHLWVSPGNKEAGLEVEGLGPPCQKLKELTYCTFN
jgi:hypothetical protein